MIEKLNNNEGVKQSQSAAGQRELLREYRNKLNEIIDSVNDHEDMLYGCDNDDDDDMALGDDAVCPDCQLARTLDTLDDLSDEQVQRLCDEAEGELERRSQEDNEIDHSACDCYAHDAELTRVDTTDGLFSDFTAYVAAHPGLRLHQAYRNWTGYSTIYGVDGVKPINLDTLEDTFYLKRKGPKA